MTIRVGLKLPQLGAHTDRECLRAFCMSAEQLSYDSLWVQEHLFYPLEPASGYSGVPGLRVPSPYQRTLSGLTVLSLAAAWTERVRLGTHLLVAGNHHPLQLAQALGTIDLISGGRLDTGLGVGWSADEHELLSVDFTRRGERFDDFIAALLACWGPDPVTHDGDFFPIKASYVGPKPLQSPHPPLLVGFFSDRGVERAVRWFDGWLTGVSVKEGAARLAEMNQRRGPGQAPLKIYGCAFPQSPLASDTDPAPGVAGVVETVIEAREAGFDEIIIDCNFWTELRSSADWAAVPERMLPALAASHP